MFCFSIEAVFFNYVYLDYEDLVMPLLEWPDTLDVADKTGTMPRDLLEQLEEANRGRHQHTHSVSKYVIFLYIWPVVPSHWKDDSKYVVSHLNKYDEREEYQILTLIL